MSAVVSVGQETEEPCAEAAGHFPINIALELQGLLSWALPIVLGRTDKIH